MEPMSEAVYYRGGTPTHIYYHAGCEPINPGGVMVGSWIAFGSADVDSASPIARHTWMIGKNGSAPRAEYITLLDALDWLEEETLLRVVFRTASMLTVKHISGEWHCKSLVLQPLLAQARTLLLARQSRVELIPKGLNAAAMALTDQTYRAHHIEMTHSFTKGATSDQ